MNSLFFWWIDSSFSCDICDKSYYKLGDLNAHKKKKTHTRIKTNNNKVIKRSYGTDIKYWYEAIIFW